MIACITSNNAIGKDDEIVVKSKEYEKWLKEEVKGTFIIVGKKTYDENVLPEDIYDNEYFILKDDVEEIDVYNEKDISIIGGEKTFETFVDQADVIKLAEMNGYYTADAFFPEFDVDCYDVKIIKDLDEKNEVGVIKEYWKK